MLGANTSNPEYWLISPMLGAAAAGAPGAVRGAVTCASVLATKSLGAFADEVLAGGKTTGTVSQLRLTDGGLPIRDASGSARQLISEMLAALNALANAQASSPDLRSGT